MKPKKSWVPGLILVFTLALGTFMNARAATITVDTTIDALDAAGTCGEVTLDSLPGPDGVISLREAMCAANVNLGEDTIEFDIPGCGGGCTIQPTIALPTLTDNGTTIDGYSQPGTTPATSTSAATILIEIEGGLIANNNGLNITSAGNLIQGLTINNFPLNGIAIGGSGAVNNVIAGNHIGVNRAGTLDLGNDYDGIFIGLGAQDNLIGGDEPAERNVLSGNDWEGVALHGSETSGNIVSGNYIGPTANGLSAKGNTLSGVRIYGGAHDNVIGGDISGERNIISGNLTEGVLIEGEEAINNVISSNYIGTDVTGLAALPNTDDGVQIDHAVDNVVGGNTPGERNLISGNGDDGVQILNQADQGNVVSGNYIGVDATGTTALPNGDDGVDLLASEGNLIGGTMPGERNIISGNSEDGILISVSHAPANIVTGNYIGVDVTGEMAMPNQQAGINISDTSASQVGGDTAAERNVISGNGDVGVRIVHPQSHDNFVIGNFIGVDHTGLAALPNANEGIVIDLGAHHNEIGGEASGEGNVISGNGSDGVRIGGLDPTDPTDFNSVAGNYIGVAADSLTPMGNGWDGVHFQMNAPQNFVGPYNIIAFNGGDGVGVDTPLSVGNAITNNSIFSNSGEGILLTNGGNNDMPAPTIVMAPSGPGTISGTALPLSIVQVFASRFPDGEGEIFLGSTVTGGVGDYTLPVTQLPFPYLTATATDSGDGTSEFSSVYIAAVPVLHMDSHKTVNRETVAPGGILTYSLALTNTGTGTATAALTDTLPTEVIWANNASASSGTLTWEAAQDRLLWTGSIDEGATAVVTFQVQAHDDLSTGTVISNVALVGSNSGYQFELHAPDVVVTGTSLYLPIVLR